MIKSLTLVRRRNAMTGEDMRANWSGPHAELSRPLPGLFRCNHNCVEDCCWSFGDNNLRLDAVGELWFESQSSTAGHTLYEVILPPLGAERGPTFHVTALVAEDSWATYSDARYKFMVIGVADAPARILASTSQALRDCSPEYAPAEFCCECLRPPFAHLPLDDRSHPNLVITIWVRTQAIAGRLIMSRRSVLRSLVATGATSAAAYRVNEMQIV
jgi:hypothetical protein